jgi:hypothetical protein
MVKEVLMIRKVIIIVITALCLCLSSCYPELSVQQYDKLKEDLRTLDIERTNLEKNLAAATSELDICNNNNLEIGAYVDFMSLLMSTQNSESLLAGEFDAAALVESKEELIAAAENLSDGDVVYYMSLIDPDNESGTVGAYYKAMEYCIKNIKQKLGVNSKP